MVEAGARHVIVLPSVKTDPDFLCGQEFDSVAAEFDFVSIHGFAVADVQIDVALQPGYLLVFDNVAVAHGRRGRHAGDPIRR